MMIIIVTSEISDLIWIYLLKLKWVNNEAFINLTLNALKVSFVMLINAKNDFHFSFFTFLINSCKDVTILKITLNESVIKIYKL